MGERKKNSITVRRRSNSGSIHSSFKQTTSKAEYERGRKDEKEGEEEERRNTSIP